MSDYLFVEGAAGGGFVPPLPAPLDVSLLSLQPVTAPITRPNSTIRVYNLFIVGVTLTNSEKRTSKNLALFLRAFLGYLPTFDKFHGNALRLLDQVPIPAEIAKAKLWQPALLLSQ
jgi:hypothetical protein